MKTHLKIKIKSLAAEARIIRHEELKWKEAPRKGLDPHPMFFSLQDHRKKDVRREARAALIAYGFLRGRAYKLVEVSSHVAPDWTRACQIACKFGKGDPKETSKRFDEWRKA
jgi:hypothetical protein